MFIVESIAKIRRMYYVDGKGIKTIARDLNISKNTVKKIIRSDATKFELAKHTKARPALGEHLNTLNKLLNDNLAEPVRRRMTAKRILINLKLLVTKGVMSLSI
jgi:predicted transcriptional regulator